MFCTMWRSAERWFATIMKSEGNLAAGGGKKKIIEAVRGERST